MLEGQTTLPRLRDLSRVWDLKKFFFLSFLFKEARFSVTGTRGGGGGGVFDQPCGCGERRPHRRRGSRVTGLPSPCLGAARAPGAEPEAVIT